MFKRIRQILCCAIIGVGKLIIFIVNSGNILTDGRRYKKRPNVNVKTKTKSIVFSSLNGPLLFSNNYFFYKFSQNFLFLIGLSLNTSFL